ncbi:hypothetical protein DSECCO2_436550 [anaerobic digester metagenome]
MEAVYVKSEFTTDPYQAETRLNQTGIELICDLFPGLKEDAQTMKDLQAILYNYFSIPGWYCHAGYITQVIREANQDVIAQKLNRADVLSRIHQRLYGSKPHRPDDRERECIRDLYYDTLDDEGNSEYPIHRLAGIFQRSTETVQRIINTTPKECTENPDDLTTGEDPILDPATTRPRTNRRIPTRPAKQTNRAPAAAAL